MHENCQTLRRFAKLGGGRCGSDQCTEGKIVCALALSDKILEPWEFMTPELTRAKEGPRVPRGRQVCQQRRSKDWRRGGKTGRKVERAQRNTKNIKDKISRRNETYHMRCRCCSRHHLSSTKGSSTFRSLHNSEHQLHLLHQGSLRSDASCR